MKYIGSKSNVFFLVNGIRNIQRKQIDLLGWAGEPYLVVHQEMVLFRRNRVL